MSAIIKETPFGVSFIMKGNDIFDTMPDHVHFSDILLKSIALQMYC